MTTELNKDLRIGVVGAGIMGADHVTRITHRMSGARVSAVIEIDPVRAAAAAATAGADIFTSVEEAITAEAVDALLIASPGPFHELALRPALAAGLPVLCEKPLTPDSASSWEIVQLDQQLDRPHVQVGFMRRFDTEYRALKDLVTAGDAGELLLMHCVHRNPDVPNGYQQSMLITDSVVHELDVVPWLAGSPIVSIEVKHARRNSLAPEHLREPIVVILELQNGTLVDVEMNVSAQFGYQVRTEAVFERGIARIGEAQGMQLWRDARFEIGEHTTYTTRFADAYDRQVQAWIDAVRDGRLVAGPNAWDGYLAALACEAGIKALDGGIVPVSAPERPAFYA